MTDDRAETGAAASAARRTLTDVDRQIAARDTRPAGVEHDVEDVVSDDAQLWSELEGEVVTRLAAGEVIATNRALTVSSLRQFLR